MTARPGIAARIRPIRSPLGMAALLSVALYATSLVLVDWDTAFSARWIALTLWLLAVLCVPLAMLAGRRHKLLDARAMRPRPSLCWLPLLALAVLTVGFSFALLVQYPFVAVYDQVRDGGLNAAEIVNGEIKNLFGFGRYDSHGLIIPTIASFFYRWFGASTLTYRLPSAILAALDVVLLYLFVRPTAGRLAAWFAALILLTLPLHLYYGRTELVVMCSAVLMTAMLLAMAALLRTPTAARTILVGLLIGFSANFHGSILTVALMTGALTLLLGCVYFLQSHRIARGVALALLLAGSALIGYGPKILFVTPATFLHTGESFSASANATSPSVETGETIRALLTSPRTLALNYYHSLRVYLNEPTRTTHFPVWQPLLDPLVGGLFLLGVVGALLSGDAVLRLLVFYAAAIPFTNSAMTNSINGDNRLLVALPVAAALAGYGVAVAYWSLRRSALVLLDATSIGTRSIALARPLLGLGLLLAIYLVGRGVWFFADGWANRGYVADDYLTMYTLRFMQAQPAYRGASQVCIALPLDRFTSLTDPDNLLLIAEQYEYFAPGKTIHFYSSGEVRPHEVYLSTSCSAARGHHYSDHLYCVHHDRFTCPPEDVLRIVAEDPGVPARPAEGFEFLGTSIDVMPRPTYIP